MTSPTVVRPSRTFFQPSSRRLRMPLRRAAWGSEAGASLSIGREGLSGGLLAILADHAYQALRQHGYQRGGDEVSFHAHIREPLNRARSVIGVQRGKHQVPGEGGADRDIGSF